MDTTFTPQAPYGVTLLVTPPVPCQLADALTTTLEGLRLAASQAGLGDVHLSTQCTLRDGQLRTRFTLLASRPGLEWHDCPVSATGSSLAQAEQAFYTQLNGLEETAYEADPCRYIDAQIESFQALEAYA